jgi:adenylylsulfate kinase
MEPKSGEENQAGITRLHTKNEGVVIWLTGLSGSGKTITGRILEKHFREIGSRVEFLDGDELRRTISSELGFSKEDRETHVRRVAFLSELLSRNGVITTVALISPYRSFREYARILAGNFVEVWVKCSLETCVKKVRKGSIRVPHKHHMSHQSTRKLL